VANTPAVNSIQGNAIQVEGLQKGFGDMPVLWDLDLTVAWGEFLVFFGANGVGKTTLLRILSTQCRPDAGTVRIAGFDLRRRSEAVRRRVGVVAHSGFLYEDLTCRENLSFYGRLYSVPDLERRVAEVLERVRLSHRADRRVRSLSHGMQKRLAIARAILHQPSLLLLDEPESGLDRESVATLAELLREWTAAGRTVVMTTHNVDLGLAWGSRVAVLSDGKLDFHRTADYLGVTGGGVSV
jgi:heme exporter protein A